MQALKKVTILLMTTFSIMPNPSFAIKAPLPSSVIWANEDGKLGLSNAMDMEIATGKCYTPMDDNAITKSLCTPSDFVVPQASWYFENTFIAVPRVVMPEDEIDPRKIVSVGPVSGYSADKNTMDDVASWAKDKHPAGTLPPLVWLGSTQVITQAKMIGNGSTVAPAGGGNRPFCLAPKLTSNLSFWDKSSDAFFANRDLRMRGTVLGNECFEAHTVWPLDYNLPANAPLLPLNGLNGETLESLVRFENGGAQSNYEARLLHGSGANIAGKTVIALMLNGAQGDDDEALGGHFALATGVVGENGDYSKWLVNNYYNLGSVSEKGIIAAPTPMDNYLMEVNSGQSYYRPSYMLVAVLKDGQLPDLVQGATNRVFNHFYRNDFLYDHSRANCAGVSIDTLRTLGWNIPMRGATSKLKAIGAYFYIAATEQSLTKGRAAYDYMSTETTRLLPAVTFDAIGNNLLNQTRKLWLDHNPQTAFTKQLSDNIEAIYFVRIPQVPSSRAFGSAPVYSFDEYMKKAPPNQADWKRVPTGERALPQDLKDGLALIDNKPALVPLPVAVVAIALFWLIAGSFLWAKRRFFNRK